MYCIFVTGFIKLSCKQKKQSGFSAEMLLELNLYDVYRSDEVKLSSNS